MKLTCFSRSAVFDVIREELDVVVVSSNSPHFHFPPGTEVISHMTFMAKLSDYEQC